MDWRSLKGPGLGADALWMIAGGVVSAVLLLPALCHGFAWDQSVFGAMADVLLRGGVLYRDAWEHKPPGVYWTYYLTFLLLGRDVWIVRLVELAGIAIASSGLVLLGRRRLGSTLAGMVAAILLPLMYFVFLQNSAQPESFQIPFIVWSAACWPDAGETARLRERCFATGILLSGIVLFKTPAVLIPLAFLADRLIQDWRRETWKENLRLTAWTAAGLAAIPVLMASYYAARGAASELLDALFVFPYHYARHNSGGAEHHARSALAWTMWLIPWPALLLLLVAFLRGIMLRPAGFFRWLGFFAAVQGAVMIQGKYFAYQHLILLPAVALGLAFAFVRPPDAPGQAGRLYPKLDPFIAGLGIMLTLLSLADYARILQPQWSLTPGLARLGTAPPPLRDPGPEYTPTIGFSSDVVRHIVAESSPEDRLFVWGDDPSLYLLSNRRMAGPYCHLLLIIPPWGDAERLRSLIRRLDVEKPRLIVVTPGDHVWRGTSIAALLAQYAEMREYIRDRYQLTRTGVGYQIWTRAE